MMFRWKHSFLATLMVVIFCLMAPVRDSFSAENIEESISSIISDCRVFFAKEPEGSISMDARSIVNIAQTRHIDVKNIKKSALEEISTNKLYMKISYLVEKGMQLLSIILSVMLFYVYGASLAGSSSTRAGMTSPVATEISDTSSILPQSSTVSKAPSALLAFAVIITNLIVPISSIKEDMRWDKNYAAQKEYLQEIVDFHRHMQVVLLSLPCSASYDQRVWDSVRSEINKWGTQVSDFEKKVGGAVTAPNLASKRI